VLDILKTHLKEMEFKPSEIKKVISNYENGIKEVVSDKKEKEKKAKVRHGTTCVGIIKDKAVVEW